MKGITACWIIGKKHPWFPVSFASGMKWADEVIILCKNDKIMDWIESLKRLDSVLNDKIRSDNGITNFSINLINQKIKNIPSNDFSAMKNFCIEKASNDWILFLDGDEVLEVFHNPLRGEPFKLIISNLHPYHHMKVPRTNYFPDTSHIRTDLRFDIQSKIFNRKYLEFTNKVHEGLTRKDHAGAPHWKPQFEVSENMLIHHFGFLTPMKEQIERHARYHQIAQKNGVWVPPDPKLIPTRKVRGAGWLEKYFGVKRWKT